MRLGMEFPAEWRNVSEQSGLAISDICYGYVVEQLMYRIYTGTFREYLWLANEDALGIEAYKRNAKGRLAFLYAPSGRKTLQEEPQAGHPMSRTIIRMLAKAVFDGKTDDIEWHYHIEERAQGYTFVIEACCLHMQVPLVLTIDEAPEMAHRPKRGNLEPMLGAVPAFCYYTYSVESVLAEQLFAVLDKLELLSDMAPYALANDILKVYSINGRHISEDFRTFTDKYPKTLSIKRLEQLHQYKTYSYMKKRWQQYEKRNGRTPEEWDVVLERILAFLTPVWTSLCENEVFFDDWMPELERFLG